MNTINPRTVASILAIVLVIGSIGFGIKRVYESLATVDLMYQQSNAVADSAYSQLYK